MCRCCVGECSWEKHLWVCRKPKWAQGEVALWHGHQQRPQLIARGALELGRLFRLGHASRQGGQGLYLLMDQSLNTGYPWQGNNMGGSSLQPKAIFSQHFWQLRNECFHPERGYLSSLQGLACGFSLGGPRLFLVRWSIVPQVLYGHEDLPTHLYPQGKVRRGTCFSSFHLLSKFFPLGHDP